MHAGLIETTVKLMTVHSGDVCIQEDGAIALCCMTKQQPVVKEYIVTNITAPFSNPFDVLVKALRLYAAKASLVKAASAALWSIAFKSVSLNTAYRHSLCASP
eukprot:SAG31_NODE_1036_length_10221_cov_170.602326_2_plen_103_part_00